MRNIYLLVISFNFINCFSQHQTNDSLYTFWQEGTKINYKDYQGPKVYTNEIAVTAQIGIWTALDLPENKPVAASNVRFYIAPVFDKKTSYAGSDDPVKLAANNIYFDIAEICARFAREKFTSILDTLKSCENISSIFKSVTKEMYEKSLRTNRQFHRNYFKENEPQSVYRWREKLDAELAATAKWITPATDCYRFIKNSPLEHEYKEDLSVAPQLVRDKYEQVLIKDTWHGGYYQVSRFLKSEKQK